MFGFYGSQKIKLTKSDISLHLHQLDMHEIELKWTSTAIELPHSLVLHHMNCWLSTFHRCIHPILWFSDQISAKLNIIISHI